MTDTPPSALPTVSVVVATRDRPLLLAKAIESIMGQNYEGDIECVVVYDQVPPDTSMERSDPHRSVVVVGNDRSPGLAGARNSGALRSRGELLAFCDDDDEWLPGKLSAQVSLLESRRADVAVSGIYVLFDGRSTARVADESSLTVLQLARRRVMEAHPSTVLVRREAFFDRIGPVDEEIPGSYGEDYDWMLRAAAAGPIAAVEEPLVRVLWGSQSFFQRDWRMVVDGLEYLAGKHEILRADPRASAKITGRQAFAFAALGDRRQALRLAWRTFRSNWRQPRSYLVLMMTAGLLRPDFMLRTAHSRGRGI
ncbi:glycosyl transferase [Planomonospora parontospora subsp. parontospora]|uniref:Glycosyl transferase n=2 Tax=Planomonospora parontospora TaxID=58119 RepID=A0AA37F852_9ACTN|nr:glycosyltransferase family A protein [Planomonospora parontospora]GGK95219.1 glycosyl transferase [Planomonospora parontospora]GII12480.1 glycosyl transferase [Planomonospora parontospora subsp. parontospora]